MEEELKQEINRFIDKMFELNQKYIKEGKEEEKSITCGIIERLDSLVD